MITVGFGGTWPKWTASRVLNIMFKNNLFACNYNFKAFFDMDPDFVLIRIQTVEKRPVRIRTKGPGSETLIYNIIIPQLWEQVQRFLLHLDPRSIHHSPAISSQQPASSLSSNQLSSSCTPQTQVKINQFALEEVWSVPHLMCSAVPRVPVPQIWRFAKPLFLGGADLTVQLRLFLLGWRVNKNCRQL